MGNHLGTLGQNFRNPVFRPKKSNTGVLGSKSTKTSFSSQNPVSGPKSTKTSFSGQTPLFSAKIRPQISFFSQNPVFAVQMDKNLFLGAKCTKTSFLFFWPKLTNTHFLGQKPVFRAKWTKINFFTQNNQNQFVWPKSTKPSFVGENPVFSAKIDQTPVFSVITQFFRSKSTKTSFFLVKINRPRPVFGVKTQFFGENHPKPVF